MLARIKQPGQGACKHTPYKLRTTRNTTLSAAKEPVATKTGRINPAVKKKPPHGQENVTNIANQNNQIQTSSNQSSFSFERYWAKAGTTNRSPNNYQPERLKPDPEDLELEDRELERDREPPKEIPPDRREDLELPILVQLLDAR